jgi:hypothetical protein
MRSKSLAGHEVGLARLSAKLIAFLELARGAGISHAIGLRQQVYSAFFEIADLERPPGGLVDQEAQFTGTITRSRRARLTFLADQPDHRSDPKPNLSSNAANANALCAQDQRRLHFPGVALLHSTTPKLLTVSTSTG